MRSKLSTLRCNNLLYDFNIFTEIWHTPDINNAELGFVGYQIFRFDRNVITSFYSNGSGILIAVKIKYVSKVLSVPINNIKQLFVVISIGNVKIVRLNLYLTKQ